MQKKNVSIAIILFILSISLSSIAFGEDITYITEKHQVTKGVSREHIRRLTKDGWLNINIIKADLNESSLSLKLLYSKQGVSTLQNTYDLAKDYNVAAAINADFFLKKNNEQNRGSSVGFNVIDRNIITTPSKNEKLASLVLDKDNNLLIDYFKFDGKIILPDGSSEPLKHINKYDSLDNIVLYNSAWGKMSQGSSATLAEAVIENDIVKEIRIDKPPVAIPENGYILAGLTDRTDFFTKKIKAGDKLVIDKKLTPNISPQLAIGGGTALLAEGKPTAITHDIPGRHPRSAIGLDKTGRLLYLIAVDGRQSISIGMTLQELQAYLKEYGLYSAINLDGGGSTVLAARVPENNTIDVINSPSEKPYRPIINAAAIASTAKGGSLEGIELKAKSQYCFSGIGIPIEVYAYDAVYSPYPYALGEVAFSVSGTDGYFSDNIYYSANSGTAVITAKYKGKTAKLCLKVLTPPIALMLNSGSFTLKSGETKPFTITGINKDGYRLNLDTALFKATITGDTAVLTKDGLRGTKKGSGTITVSYGNLNITAPYSTDTSGTALDAAAQLADDFEKINAQALPFPSYVSSAYAISKEQAKTGSYSGKLWFDFSIAKPDLQSAAVKFNNPPEISESTTDLGLWVYNEKPNKLWLRALITDAQGSVSRITLAEYMDWSGWRYLKAQMPDNLAYPAGLSRIYIVQHEKTDTAKGAIYLDQLELYTKPITTATASTYTDPLKGEGSGTKLAFFAGLTPNKSLLNLLIGDIIKKRLSGYDSSVILGGKTAVPANLLPIKRYYIEEKNNIAVMYLDNTGGSIRTADFEQWKWFLTKINELKAKVVVITTPQPFIFTDKDEEALLRQKLTGLFEAGKTVFSVSHGSVPSTDTINGVRYITLPEYATDIKRVLKDDYSYLELCIGGDRVSYDVKTFGFR